ncbi:MAG: response regulator [Planctomycetes bacterium]|nr:response regulator [Planctomycetota bacterium]
MAASSLLSPSALRRNLLIVEDNPADATLLVESLAESDGPQIDHCRAVDGIAAIALLAGPSPFADGAPPHLILVDLVMPRMDGRTLLQALRETVGWVDIPIFVLSSSAQSDDIAECYALGADDYVAKPGSWDGYRALAATIKRFLSADERGAAGDPTDTVAARLRAFAKQTTSAVATSRLVIESSRDCLRYRPRKP